MSHSRLFANSTFIYAKSQIFVSFPTALGLSPMDEAKFIILLVSSFLQSFQISSGLMPFLHSYLSVSSLILQIRAECSNYRIHKTVRNFIFQIMHPEFAFSHRRIILVA